MGEEKALTQRRYGTRLTYRFAANQLTYTIRDYSGEREFSVPYESINVLAPASLVVNRVQFYRTLLIVPLVMVALAIAVQSTDKAASQYLTLTGIVLFIILLGGRYLRLFAIKFTTLQMAPAPPGAGTSSLLIMKDKRHAAIFDEIRTRWRTRLRQLHGSINFANDASAEVAKFTWLKDRAIITDNEYREAVEKLRKFGVQSPPSTTERTLN
jgi:hypothetical protein